MLPYQKKTESRKVSLVSVFCSIFSQNFFLLSIRKKLQIFELGDHITEAIAIMTKVMFVIMWCKIEYCFSVCQATNGAYIETY
jgi:hypothetical protein